MHASQMSVAASPPQGTGSAQSAHMEKLYRLALLQEALDEIRYTQRSSWDTRLKALAEAFRTP